MANILGINLSELRPSEALSQVDLFLKSDKQNYLVTPNPEIILASHKDEEFFYILNKADLAISDGFGLTIAAKIFGNKIYRVTGADLTLYLLKKAAMKKIKIIILNWESGLSSQKEIANSLIEKYPSLDFKIIDISRDKFLSEEIIENINSYAPQILFCNLGFPYQEKVIYHNLSKLSSVKLALGIGGSFDFITDKIKRAPKFLRKLGLEWLWRLFKQPKRIGRIFNATVVFFFIVLKSRFINPFFYRPNVACLLYKKEDNNIKILIVAREDDPTYWQIPQGGTDGEKIEIAGARELNEELGTNKFRGKVTYKNIYRYYYAKNLGKRTYQRQDKKINQIAKRLGSFKHDYKGQKQSLYIAKYLGDDKDIKINFWDHIAFKWVLKEDFVASVHPSRKPSAEIFLKKLNELNLD